MPIFIPVWVVYLGIYLGGVCSGLVLILIAAPFIMMWAVNQEHKLQTQVRASDREAEVKATQQRYNDAVKKGTNEPE